MAAEKKNLPGCTTFNCCTTLRFLLGAFPFQLFWVFLRAVPLFYLVAFYSHLLQPRQPHNYSMSSMRNAVQRRQHRERGQLEGREKWGLLEKHKVGSLILLLEDIASSLKPSNVPE